MKVGIVLYSQTGNTLAVAEQLQAQLVAASHEVQIERLTLVGELPKPGQPVVLANLPDLSGYQAIVFGAPVQGFSLAAPMKTYLQQIEQLNNRPVGLLVTQFFPYAWMGGNRTVQEMQQLCQAKGARIAGNLVVNWKNGQRERQIADGVRRLAACLQS